MTNFDMETEREINNFRILERYMKTLEWSKDASDYLKTCVIGNIRNVYYWLYHNDFIDKDKIQEYFWREQIEKDKKLKELHEGISH